MPIILITGANRGIGLAYVQAYAQKGWTVVAAVRDPASMPKVEGKGEGTVIVVEIRADSRRDAEEAVKDLRDNHNITSFDVVVANAGKWDSSKRMVDLDYDDAEMIWKTNVLGPLVLFKAIYQSMPRLGKFVIISSDAGQITTPKGPGTGAYGQSKVAVNFLIKHLHAEHPELICVAFNPGWVQTDMGNAAAEWTGRQAAPLKMEDTMPGMMKNIEIMTRENMGGKLINWNGKTLDW